MKTKFINAQIPNNYSEPIYTHKLAIEQKGPDGRIYQLLGLSIKNYSLKHQFWIGIRTFAQTFFSFGLLLLREDVRENWKVAWTGKRVVVLYMSPLNINTGKKILKHSANLNVNSVFSNLNNLSDGLHKNLDHHLKGEMIRVEGKQVVYRAQGQFDQEGRLYGEGESWEKNEKGIVINKKGKFIQGHLRQGTILEKDETHILYEAEGCFNELEQIVGHSKVVMTSPDQHHQFNLEGLFGFNDKDRTILQGQVEYDNDKYPNLGFQAKGNIAWHSAELSVMSPNDPEKLILNDGTVYESTSYKISFNQKGFEIEWSGKKTLPDQSIVTGHYIDKINTDGNVIHSINVIDSITNFSLQNICTKFTGSDLLTHHSSYLDTSAKINLYEKLGAHLNEKGVQFAVYAPNAKSISVILYNDKLEEEKTIPLTFDSYGNWECQVDGINKNQKYRYLITDQEGNQREKVDPYGFAFMPNLKTYVPYSVVTDRNYQWQDSDWMSQRVEKNKKSAPMNIYEVHVTTWKKKDHKQNLNYRELAHELGAYCKKMGYTHVELMGVLEHPDERSWGYQVTGYFAPNHRMGTPEDFKYLVDFLHKEGIAIILDWVPAHFAMDKYALQKFDGSPLYEPRKNSSHPDWGTYVFDPSLKTTRNFLYSSALFWLKEMHIDGLRIDAVTTILHMKSISQLNKTPFLKRISNLFSKKVQHVVSDSFDSIANWKSKHFFKHLNAIIHENFPGVITVAEEYDGVPNLTKNVKEKGLGFDYKWGLGWMFHTLNTIKTPSNQSWNKQHQIINGLNSDSNEHAIVALSHDEVSNGKQSLLNKPPVSDSEKFANLRLLLSYMMCVPGKKLSFMGNEFGQPTEWSWHLLQNEPLRWEILQDRNHKNVQKMVKTLNHFYLKTPAFWENEDSNLKCRPIALDDSTNNVICFERKSSEEKYFCFHNFSPNEHKEYHLYFPNQQDWQHLKRVTEVFNSDGKKFGGEGRLNENVSLIKNEKGNVIGMTLHIAPFSTMILKQEF